jgi:predicted ATPase with chaperone activity
VLCIRGRHCALRVARTIVDLVHSECVDARHLEKALSLPASAAVGDLAVA